jgi:hypothetical protein
MVVVHLTVFLPDIIRPTQSAFVPRRMITDNILVVYECFHTIKNKREGKKKGCVLSNLTCIKPMTKWSGLF